MGLKQNLINEPVSKLALRKAITASPDLPIRDAVNLMKENSLGCVIVVDDDEKPIGIFTESILRNLLQTGTSFLDDPLEKQMADRCPWVKQTDPIQTVLEAMQINNVRFICVVDDEGKVAALTGQKGLMEYIAEHYPREVLVQRIEPEVSNQEREGA